MVATEGRTEETKTFVAVYRKAENTFPVGAPFALYVVNGLSKDCIFTAFE